MKKISWLLFLFMSFVSFVHAQSADAVLGTWWNQEKDAKITMYKNGNTYEGKITWLKNMYEDDGTTPRKDSKNSDSKLRTRTLMNLVILHGFKYDDGEWTGGKIYDPKSGKTYSSKMELDGSNELDIRGYIGAPLFGRTTTWTRADR